MEQKLIPEQKVIFNDISSIPVYIVGGKFQDSEHTFPLHMHDEVEILVALRGPVYISNEKESFTLNKNDVVLVNKRVPHTTTYPAYSCTNMLQFRMDKATPLLSDKTSLYLSYFANDSQHDLVYLDSNHPVSKIIAENIKLMLLEKETKNKYYELYIQAYLRIILATLYRNNIFKDITDYFHNESLAKVMPVIKYIEENYNKKLSLDYLCTIINMTKSHMCRLFKKAIGITVIDFINFVRIWNAENLLTSTDDKVLNISMDVGFSNISYFNRIFKKTTGMTPLAYKDIINANKTKKTLTHS